MTIRLSGLANTVHTINNSNLPLGALIVEIPTDIGRSYAGYKRGGILEGAEKFRKEVMAAAIWLMGIPAFKWAGDRISEKLLKIPMEIDFSLDNKKTGNTSIKDTVEFLTQKTKEDADKFLKQKAKDGDFVDISEIPARYFKDNVSIFAGRDAKSMIKTVRGAKIATSILAFSLNVIALGVALPLFNQALTRKKMKKINANKNNAATMKVDSLDEFRSKTQKNKNDSLAFTGMNSLFKHPLASFVDGIENSSTFRLIAPDAPMIAGRVKTSRNKYEAIENGFIDISGIFLYNFCADLIQNRARKFTNTSSIAPTISEIIISKDEGLIKNAIKKVNESAKNSITLEELFNKETAQEIYKNATYGKYGKINKYVKNETLQSIDESVCNFLKQLSKGKSDITKEDIIKFAKSTNHKNGIFLAIGLLTAIIGQAILVPKIAFKITEKLTGKNEFTGIAHYDNKNNSNAS